MDNLFFAVVPDGPARARISAIDLRGSLDPSARPLPASRFHVSVQSLGEHRRVPDLLVAQALRMGARVEVPAFAASFDRVLGFNAPDGHAVVLAGASAGPGFKNLRRAICGEMQLAGMQVGRSLDFTPHVTLAYQDTKIGRIDIEPVGWVVGAFVLIKRSRGRHVRLGHWPLQGCPSGFGASPWPLP